MGGVGGEGGVFGLGRGGRGAGGGWGGEGRGGVGGGGGEKGGTVSGMSAAMIDSRGAAAGEPRAVSFVQLQFRSKELTDARDQFRWPWRCSLAARRRAATEPVPTRQACSGNGWPRRIFRRRFRAFSGGPPRQQLESRVGARRQTIRRSPRRSIAIRREPLLSFSRFSQEHLSLRALAERGRTFSWTWKRMWCVETAPYSKASDGASA